MPYSPCPVGGECGVGHCEVDNATHASNYQPPGLKSPSSRPFLGSYCVCEPGWRQGSGWYELPGCFIHDYAVYVLWIIATVALCGAVRVSWRLLRTRPFVFNLRAKVLILCALGLWLLGIYLTLSLVFGQFWLTGVLFAAWWCLLLCNGSAQLYFHAGRLC